MQRPETAFVSAAWNNVRNDCWNHEGHFLKRLEIRSSGNELKRGINLAVNAVVGHLKTRAKVISTTEEVAQVSICDLIEIPALKSVTYRGKRRVPEFNDKMTRKVTGVDGSSAPAWVNARLKLVIQGKLQSRAGYGTRDWSHDPAEGNGSRHLLSAGTTSEAIAVLKNRLQRGTTTGSYTYVKVLQMCLGFRVSRSDHGLWCQQRKRRVPEFDDKTTRKATGVDGSSAPAWVNARLKLIIQGKLQSRASYGTRDWSQDAAQGNGSRHLLSAGTTSEAIAVLKNRLQRGITTDSYTYVKVLQMCLKQRNLLAAKQVHGCIIQSGMEKNPYVANNLLNVYLRCGGFLDARRVFYGLEKKGVITWTMMIAAYAKSDHAESALELFKLMRQEGVQPNEVTYLCILKACASPSALKWGKEVHECLRHTGFESDVRVGTALLQMYVKCGCMTEARRVFDKLTNRNSITWSLMIGAYAASGKVDDARLLFDRMKKRDLITWNTVIGAYAESGHGVEAYRLFLEMRREGFEPNAITYMSILNAKASASAGALEWVKEVNGHARKAGLESDLRVGNALVHMYAKSGSIDDARLLFDRLKKRDVVTWNAMIGGLAQHGCGHEALELFRKLNSDLVKPNRTTFVAVLSACCHAGLLDDGRRLFSDMTRNHGIEPDIVHYTCMVDLLGRAGRLEEAKLFIRDMPVAPNEVTWKALLGACRTYGNVELGELAAEELFKLEPRNSSAYVLLSNIYAAAGKWEKASLVRTMMQTRGVRKQEPGRSSIEVDNKVHEFVVGDTAHPEAKEIYAYINKLTEQLKAEGYIPDTQIVLQNIDEEDKELALCSHSEKLAIAYGLMRIPQDQPIRVTKNLRVCSDCHTATKLISKVTGREIIARDASRFHHFKDGGCSCGDYW